MGPRSAADVASTASSFSDAHPKASRVAPSAASRWLVSAEGGTTLQPSGPAHWSVTFQACTSATLATSSPHSDCGSFCACLPCSSSPRMILTYAGTFGCNSCRMQTDRRLSHTSRATRLDDHSLFLCCVPHRPRREDPYLTSHNLWRSLVWRQF